MACRQVQFLSCIQCLQPVARHAHISLLDLPKCYMAAEELTVASATTAKPPEQPSLKCGGKAMFHSKLLLHPKSEFFRAPAERDSSHGAALAGQRRTVPT